MKFKECYQVNYLTKEVKILIRFPISNHNSSWNIKQNTLLSLIGRRMFEFQQLENILLENPCENIMTLKLCFRCITRAFSCRLGLLSLVAELHYLACYLDSIMGNGFI